MTDPQDQLKQGLIWLGSAAAIGRIVDLASTVTVLFFLSKEEVGVATIAWAIGMVLEAVCRLGLGVAILQTKEVSREQLDTSFWAMTLAALLLGGSAVAIGPFLGPLVHEPQLALFLIPSAAKMLFLVWAEIPIQLLSRKLQFASIAGVSTGATVLSAIARVLLAATGFGAWTLLIAQTVWAFFMWVGATLVQPFFPRFRLRLGEIRSFLRFGKYITGERIMLEAFQNVDYLILGALSGPAVVGVYRVAFDVAMTPAVAIAGVLNRAALPVMARLRRTELGDLFVNTSGKLAVFLGAVCAIIIASAEDVTWVFQKGEYAAAAAPAQLLAVAAALRVLYQLFPDMFNAAGMPSVTFRFGMLSLIVLGSCLGVSISWIGIEHGATALAAGWVGVYPILIPLAVWAGASELGLNARAYRRSLVAPALSAIVATCVGLAMHTLVSQAIPSWWARTMIVVTATLLTYLGTLGLLGRVKSMFSSLRK
jgi:O-antigen/teichoic acid export membrane protein